MPITRAETQGRVITPPAVRNPEGLHFDFRNNVVYNWLKTVPGYGDSGTEVSRYNFIGNVYIPGPESTNNGFGYRESSSVCYGYFGGQFIQWHCPG